LAAAGLAAAVAVGEGAVGLVPMGFFLANMSSQMTIEMKTETAGLKPKKNKQERQENSQ
jgi:hypothetical protein